MDFLSWAALFAITQGQLLISTARIKLGGVFPGRNGWRLIELQDSQSVSSSESLQIFHIKIFHQLKIKSHLRLIDLLVFTAQVVFRLGVTQIRDD